MKAKPGDIHGNKRAFQARVDAITRALDAATEFFYTHSGYSVSADETEDAGRRECARALALAEAHANEVDASFEWSIDEDIDSSHWNDDDPPYATWSCVARDANGDVFASLGGVDFGRDSEPCDPYRRVVEAELACELSHEGE